MRTPPWPALVLSLLALLATPARAQENPAAPVLHPRPLPWAPGAPALELLVAPGAPTLVRLEAFPQLLSLELTEGPSSLQLVPLSGASFLLLPPSDFARGERALVTVRLGPPDLRLPLLLVSRREAADAEVRLVRLRAPEALEVDALARFLNDSPLERVSLTVDSPWLQGSKLRVRVEALLRLDSRVFVTLAVCPAGRNRTPLTLERARLRIVMEDGSEVDMPLLLVPRPPERHRQRYTLVASLPERALRLLLAVEADGAPEGFFPLPSGEEEPSP